MEAIARQIPYRIVFLIVFEGEGQFALYQRKLYRTPWNEEKNLTLTAEGFSLNEIWDGFIERITSWGNWVVFFSHLNISAWLQLGKQGVNELQLLCDQEIRNIDRMQEEIDTKWSDLLERSKMV